MDNSKYDEHLKKYMNDGNELIKDFDKKNGIIENGTVIYHYTGYDSFCKILESGCLRFTNCKQLNDPLELQYFMMIARDTIHKCFNKKNVYFWIPFQKKFDDIGETYICSFCERNDCLPVWRWYGNNAAGIAIGFRFNLSSESHDEREYRIARVNYDKAMAENVCRNIVELTDKSICMFSGNYKDKIRRRYFNENLFIDLMCLLLSLFPCFKISDYKSEEEVRCFIRSIPPRVNPIPQNEFVTYQRHDGIPVPFVNKSNINIEAHNFKFEKNQICEVWIGPRCNFKKAKKFVLGELKKHGYEINKIRIEQPTISYRG